jgi:hypothetical protein
VSHAASSQKLNNDAATGSDELDIPEPLVFDLVRPLGSPQGELEVNFFASRINGQGQLSWSPEVEYVIADGYAVELELPHTNGSLDEYKMALQGTAGTLLGGSMIHGWQFITRKTLGGLPNHTDILYLNGWRLNNRISTMNMLGWRRTDASMHGRDTLLLNASLFYKRSSRLTLGIEVNAEHNALLGLGYRLTPQVHVTLKDNTALQFGLGPSTLNTQRDKQWILVGRYSYSF